MTTTHISAFSDGEVRMSLFYQTIHE